MNREIKFRAWDKSTNRMFPSSFDILGEVAAFYLVEQWLMQEPLNRTTLDRIGDVVVLQFAGVKDKNGKEIFEGDLISTHDTYSDKPVCIKVSGSQFVCYNPQCCDICRNSFGCISSLSECLSYGEVEVVGNLFQNPEIYK